MKAPHVDPPSDHDDAEALREYGRQIAMDSLIKGLAESESGSEELQPASKIIEAPVRSWQRRAWIGTAAAAIVGLISLTFWDRTNDPKLDHLATLDPSWQLHAESGASYRILAPGHVKLLEGELRFSSAKPAELLVETPHAKAKASGTDFLIAHYDTSQSEERDTNTEPTEIMKNKSITRLLVLTGAVTLATNHGTVTANENEAAVATPDKSPEKILVEANSSFAFQSYAQLAKENEGENLFFSPYSISNALLMVTEGARGQTAQEMGKVLGFPEGLRRIGNGAQQIPWEMSVIRSGQTRLNKAFVRSTEQSEQDAARRVEMDSLKQQMEQLQQLAGKLRKEGKKHDSEEMKELKGKFRATEKQVIALRKKLDSHSLNIANAVWGDNRSEFKEAWKNTVSETYGTGAVQPANFSTKPEEERQRINAWVAAQTKDRIKGLFGPGSITSDTNLVLANAIHFEGSWRNPFSKRRTTPSKFQLPNGETTEISLMNKITEKGIRYAAFNGDGSFFRSPITIPRDGSRPPTYPEKNGFSMVEMPYRGNGMSMIAIAPNDSAGLPALEAQLTAENVAGWISSLKRRKTMVLLPKFEMKTKYRLNESLEAMGMPSAFSTSAADFSGISSEPNYISVVVHQAFIKVDEEGTEAAAATGVAIDRKSIPVTIPFTPTFYADRPFIYLIRDTKTGTILFLGRVMNPNL